MTERRAWTLEELRHLYWGLLDRSELSMYESSGIRNFLDDLEEMERTGASTIVRSEAE